MNKIPCGIVKLAAVGDIMLGDMPSCFGFGVNSQVSRYGPQFPWHHVADRLGKSDVLFGNLEAVLSESGRNRFWLPSLYMRGSSKCVKTLKSIGFDVLAVANNHMMQHGSAAYHETVAAIEEQSIQCIGNAFSKPLKCIDRGGISFGFLGYSLRPEEYKPGEQLYALVSPDDILEQVREFAPAVDHLIVSVHWGDEFVTVPSSAQVQTAHDVIDAGASVLLGHHPHVVQGVEMYKGGLIAYSLGNFIFDMPLADARDAAILEVQFDEQSVVSYETVPVRINQRHQPELVAGDEADEMRKEFELRSSLISLDGDSGDYDARVRAGFSRYRQSVKCVYGRSFFRYNPFYFAQLIGLVILRRVTKLHI